jgi:hypothetical protein
MVPLELCPDRLLGIEPVTGVLARLDYGLMRAESSGQAEVEYVAYGDDEVVPIWPEKPCGVRC